MFRETKLDVYKGERGKIKCYIREWYEPKSGKVKYDVCTGKPSDASCMCAKKATYEEAKVCAMDYFKRVTLGKEPKITTTEYFYGG